MVLLGQLKLDDEQTLIHETKEFLAQRAATQPAYAAYLDRWGDWINPWHTSTTA